jgi:hypothetical protein
MYKLYYLFIVGILISACSKEQRTANKLSGVWEVRSAVITNLGEVNSEQQFEFEKCRIRKNNYCDFTLVDRNNNEITYGSYLINEEGDEVTMVFTEGLTITTHTFIIDKVNWRKLILTNKHPNPGTFERFELRSI